MNLRTAAVLLLITCPLTGAARADEVALVTDRDNTLYESRDGGLSNAKGLHLFAGLTNAGELRRGLLHFDVAGALPPGARVIEVALTLHVSKLSNSLPKQVALHRLTNSWGEGASAAGGEEGKGDFAEPGDATWLHRFFPDVVWASEGGDFDATPSAAVPVTALGAVTWSSTPALVADVQLWLDDPTQNAGWLLRGEEQGNDSSRRFNTREYPNPAERPQLTIVYEAPGCAPQPFDDLGASLAGTHGAPRLTGATCFVAGEPLTLALTDALEHSTTALVLGLAAIHAPLKGGVLVPEPFFVRFGLPVDAAGAHTFSVPWPDAVPSGTTLHAQHWIVDPAGPSGFAASNAVAGTMP